MRRRRSEQGAVAIFVAIVTAAVLLPIGALTVDIGMQRVARRDMQALADQVALDLARQLDGKTAAVALYPSLDSLADQSAARNAGNSFSDGATVAPVLGTIDTDLFGQPGYFTELPVGSTAVPDAVKVVASTTVDFSFTSGSGGVTRSSIATADSAACFQLGSYALRLSSTSSPLLSGLLNGVLGANLAAASYTDLADAGAVVPLADLATELGLGSADELGGASVSLRDLYVAVQHVLANNGRSAEASIVGTLAASASGSGSLALANVLDVAAGGNAAAGGSLRALDLIAMSAFLSNGTNLLSLPSVTADALGLTGVASSLALLEGKQVACGKIGAAQATTSQIDLTVSGKPTTLPSILGLTATTPTSSQLSLEVASGSGTLADIVCGAGTAASPEGVDASVTSGLVQPFTLAVPVHLEGTVPGLTISLDVTATVTNAAAPSAQTASVRVPTSNASWATPTPTGSGSLGLSGVSVGTNTANLTVKDSLTGLNTSLPPTLSLADITAAVTSGIVSPLVSSLDTNLLEPLSELLGLRLGGVDVFGVEAPVCSNPAIVG